VLHDSLTVSSLMFQIYHPTALFYKQKLSYSVQFFDVHFNFMLFCQQALVSCSIFRHPFPAVFREHALSFKVPSRSNMRRQNINVMSVRPPG